MYNIVVCRLRTVLLRLVLYGSRFRQWKAFTVVSEVDFFFVYNPNKLLQVFDCRESSDRNVALFILFLYKQLSGDYYCNSKDIMNSVLQMFMFPPPLIIHPLLTAELNHEDAVLFFIGISLTPSTVMFLKITFLSLFTTVGRVLILYRKKRKLEEVKSGATSGASQ